jgi:hypothetical protein
MVAFWHLGVDDMSVTAEGRRKRRQKCTELVLFLLDEKPDGWRFADLHKIVSDSMRTRLSRTGMGMIMRPYFSDGTIIRERISDNGVECHIWRKQ